VSFTWHRALRSQPALEQFDRTLVIRRAMQVEMDLRLGEVVAAAHVNRHDRGATARDPAAPATSRAPDLRGIEPIERVDVIRESAKVALGLEVAAVVAPVSHPLERGRVPLQREARRISVDERATAEPARLREQECVLEELIAESALPAELRVRDHDPAVAGVRNGCERPPVGTCTGAARSPRRQRLRAPYAEAMGSGGRRMRTGPSSRGRLIAGTLTICALSFAGALPAAAGGARLTYEKSWWSRSRVLSPRAFFAAWSPDSRTIAATRYDRDGHGQLLAIDVGTGATRVLASPAGTLGSVSFSPGGETLVYAAAGRSSGSDLYTVPVAGGGPTQLTHDHRSDNPLWGPRAIAFTRLRSVGRGAQRTVRSRIWLLQPGGAPRPLTAEHAGGITPIAWSANGHRLLGELSGGTAATAFQYAVTVSALTGAVQAVGKPSASNSHRSARR
jgi:hypothetical protein